MSLYIDVDVTTRIEAAAIMVGKIVCFLPYPARHHDVIREMVEAGYPAPIAGVQGFVTNKGTFVGRRLAKLIAVRAEQTIASHNDEELYTEDLW